MIRIKRIPFFVKFVVYKNDHLFIAFLVNSPVEEYLQFYAELGDRLTVEVYVTVGNRWKAAMEKTELPLKFLKTTVSVARE